MTNMRYGVTGFVIMWQRKKFQCTEIEIFYVHIEYFYFCVLKGYILSRVSGRGRLNVNTKMGGMYLSLFSQPNIRDYMGNL